jgi:hypothetical protein
MYTRPVTNSSVPFTKKENRKNEGQQGQTLSSLPTADPECDLLLSEIMIALIGVTRTEWRAVEASESITMTSKKKKKKKKEEWIGWDG